MNRIAFFNTIRPAFGGSLVAAQVAGINALLDAGSDLSLHHMANLMAQVRRETGGYMSPIKETVMPSHKDKHPSDEEVIRRLDRAFAAGKLKWVKEPYWRDGWFGRGPLQVTHRANYRKFGITDPYDMLKHDIGARVAVEGMVKGMFTGKKLSDYDFPAALDAPPARNPRRIVNGVDGSDKEVARFHRQFAAALQSANWGTLPARPDAPAPPLPEAIIPHDQPKSLLAALWRALVGIITGKGA
jgi:predicted chitinase